MSVPVFHQITDDSLVSHELASIINEKLSANQRVLWLIAGGSVIKVALNIAGQLKPPLNNLIVSLTDERYGPVGHPNSNWKALKDAGLSLPGATLLPVLAGKDMDSTAAEYGNNIAAALHAADYSLALAGMGPDGHIFGIKPGSPSANSDKEIVAYRWDDYERITPTINLIKKIDEVFIYAVGSEKWHQFDNLAKDLDPEKQPAQLLKQLKRVTIFSDYKGD